MHIEYNPNCYICRTENGKDPAGIYPDVLCDAHYKSEYVRLKEKDDRLYDMVKGVIRASWEGGE